MPSVQQELRDTLHQRLLPPVPSFVGNKVGEDLCVTILSMARADRFEHALAYGKRGEWLKSKMPLFFDESIGIFAIYRRTRVGQVQNIQGGGGSFKDPL